MYKLPPSGSFSFRIDEEKKELVQQVADELQTISGKEFSNAGEIVYALINRVKTLENELQTAENNLKATNKVLETAENKLNDIAFGDDNVDELQPLLDQAKEILYGEEIPENATAESIIQDLIGVASEPAPTPQVVEKEIEKVVERELSADEILLKLSPKQIELLNLIARWRHSKKLDEELKTPGQIIEGMVFNKGALLNWGESFRTGIKRKNLG